MFFLFPTAIHLCRPSQVEECSVLWQLAGELSPLRGWAGPRRGAGPGAPGGQKAVRARSGQVRLSCRHTAGTDLFGPAFYEGDKPPVIEIANWTVLCWPGRARPAGRGGAGGGTMHGRRVSVSCVSLSVTFLFFIAADPACRPRNIWVSLLHSKHPEQALNWQKKPRMRHTCALQFPFKNFSEISFRS